MNILMIGGTGFVGKHLMNVFKKQRRHVYIVTRNPKRYKKEPFVTYLSYKDDLSTLPYISVVINLAGESLFGYWTKKKKENILTSRLETTAFALKIISQSKKKPKVFINSSAVGFYGTSKNKVFTEKTTKPGKDFLATVVSNWEKTARKATQYNVRTIYARFGLILGTEGALPLMSLPVKMFVGGKVGKGDQWISWIHIEDVVHLILHCMEDQRIHGPINFTSPQPIRNKDFMKKMAKILKRPYYFPTPALFPRIILSEMSDLILKGQYVLPEKAKTFDYTFKYSKIEESFSNLFGKL